jgi:ABC-type Fe3+ transport system permease subunit
MPRFRKGAGWHAAELRRPELVSAEQLSRRRVGASDEGEASRTVGREQHWRAVDILAMVVAALQVMLPLVLVILAAVAGAYGLFMLAFG